MSVQSEAAISCAHCGKKYPWKPEYDGKQLKCKCGQIIIVPTRSAAGDDDAGEYDFAEPEPAPGPKPGLASAGISADVVLSRVGMIPVPKPKAPDPQALAAAKAMQSMLEPSPLFDVTIPIFLTAIGLCLSFLEIRYASGHGRVPVALAIALTIGRAVFSAGLMIGGIYLSILAFEVCIVGSFTRSMFKLAAIAIGPSAVYGLLSYAVGDVAGSTTGTLSAILIYGLLFRFLLKLDLKDTAVCVIVTWILITAINYGAYKLQGASSGSWI